MIIGYDSIQRFLGSPDLLKLNHPHKTANVGIRTDVSVRGTRDSIVFETSDFPTKSSTYDIMNVEGYDAMYGNLANWSYFGAEGSNQPFYFDFIDQFPSAPAQLVYLDPASTAWAANFKTAVAAKLSNVRKDAGGNTIAEFYEFYEIQGNNFVAVGIGAKVDKGVLSTGTPNGTYAYAHAKINPAHRYHSTDMTLRATLRDSSFWRAQVTEGFSELRHFEHLKTVRRVNAGGVLHLSHDSFEVVQVR